MAIYNFMTYLPDERIKEIENITINVLQNVFNKSSVITPPITFKKLIERVEAELYYAKFEFLDVSGQLIKKGGKNKIYVAKSDSGVRQRFTIVHELGHIELHSELTKDIYRSNQAYRNSN